MTDLLNDWTTLNTGLMNLSEDECESLLKKEEKGQNRFSFIVRISGRLGKLRRQRERAELLKQKVDK